MKDKKEQLREESFYYKKDRLNQLRGFCTAVQSECNLTKAANQVGLEVATIGKQIRSLERDINISLFDRSVPNKLKLTEDGQEFYDEAVIKLQGIDSLFNNYSKEKEQKRKRQINVAGLYVLLERMIPYLNELKKFYPDAEISFYNITKDEAFKKLIKKEIDLVFYPGDNDETYPVEVARTKITEEKVYWVFYENHPLLDEKYEIITGEKVSKYPFGIISGGSYSQKFEKFIKDFKIKSPVNLIYGTSNMIIQMIKNKMCMSILSGFYLNIEDKKELILKDSNNIFDSHLYLYSLKNTKQKEILKKFLEITQKNKKTIFH